MGAADGRLGVGASDGIACHCGQVASSPMCGALGGEGHRERGSRVGVGREVGVHNAGTAHTEERGAKQGAGDGVGGVLPSAGKGQNACKEEK